MAMRRDDLELYRQKRDFSKTPEPEGIPATKPGHRYLIQKHAASRLHYDFRLELDGVLKSWAVTRGPSLDPQVKRLAVEVEDHPVSYGSFEGIIPEGQYGGGTVMLWDDGNWEPIGDPHEGLSKGKLEFKLYGRRLSGEWTLVRMRDLEKAKGRHNWLLIKRTDKAAKKGDADDLLKRNSTSVVSGRTMEEIAKAQEHVWQSKKNSGEISRVKPKAVRGKSSTKMPAFSPPQLATLTDTLPEGGDWVHEIKFDGYRGLAYIQKGQVAIYTRTGKDWTHKFRALADQLEKLPAETAILDGEIVALNDKGGSSFKALQNALSDGHDEILQYYVFDLLYLNGEDLTGLSLIERKKRLQPLLQNKAFKNKIFYSEHVAKRDKAFLQKLCSMDMEGVISKRINAPYTHGRGTAWLKTKCHKRQEFVIGGFTPSSTGQALIGSLLLGYYEGEDFVYAGRVGTGFDTETAGLLYRRLNVLKRAAMPYTKYSEAGRRGPGWKRGVTWVEPKLVCEVEFTEWTEEGALRHPSFQGLREDKPAASISRETPMAVKTVIKSRKSKPPSNQNALVGGISISHPDRLLYPGTDITKQELAEYYHAVSGHILPHVKNRPLSMVRCPEGTEKECFFQRHIARGQSPYLHDTGIAVNGRKEDYLMIKDAKGLITLIQWGVIELHPWGCMADKPDLPDRLIFDLDPDPELPFSQVIQGAKEVRERMQEFGLQSFVKTTGGKGLHVVIPMIRSYEWDTVKSFARAIATSMQHDNPERYIAKSSKVARRGKIFVDYLRNDLTSTSISAFSARAREGAPVALPVSWEDLSSKLQPRAYTIETVPEILRNRKNDPWVNFFKVKQKISAKHLRALKISFK